MMPFSASTPARTIALRTALRQSPQRLSRTPAQHLQRRLIGSSTHTPNKSYGWKSFVARWGVAVGAVYWYNTSNAFAEEHPYPHRVVQQATQDLEEALPTIESIHEAKKQQRAATIGHNPPPTPTKDSKAQSTTQSTSSTPSSPITTAPSPIPTSEPTTNSPEDLEEEASQQGAFNEETGEINWECPCLGGMAHGPCGTEFREAFSCFVYSKDEPKGVDCIDKFKGMQECFRLHPEVYGAELSDDDDGEDGEIRDGLGGPDDGFDVPAPMPAPGTVSASASTPTPAPAPKGKKGDTSAAPPS